MASQEGDLFSVAPFILVVDCSYSMSGVMEMVNAFVPDLIATMREIPEALESVALGIVSFNDTARIVRPLTWLDEEITMPKFVAGGRTSYVQPLDRTRELIQRDTPKLGDRGFRPVVFFVTDAQPNVEKDPQWLAARARLLDPRFTLHPKLVAFGFGDVNVETLRKLASDPSLAEFNDKAHAAAVAEILKIVMNTVITLTAGGAKGSDGSLASRLVDSAVGYEDDTLVYVP